MRRRRKQVRARREKPQAAIHTDWIEEVLFSFTDAVAVCDDQARVVLFNQAAEELTGLSRARVIGRPCEEASRAFPFSVPWCAACRSADATSREERRCSTGGSVAFPSAFPVGRSSGRMMRCKAPFWSFAI